MLSATDKKALLAQYQAIFDPFKGKTLTIAWSNHTFDAVFEDIRVATQAQLQNKPDKREIDGKERTPQVIQVCVEGDNTLDFVSDRIDNVHSTLRGAEIVTTDGIKVSFNVHS